MRVRRLLPLFATLAISCDSDDTLENINTRATAIVVDPAQFLGAFPCGDIEGAPRSFSATLYRVEASSSTGGGGAGAGGDAGGGDAGGVAGGGGGGAGGGVAGGGGAGGGDAGGAPSTGGAGAEGAAKGTFVATSGRVGCGTPIAFTDIESGELYAADVLVFDVPPEEGDASLTPTWTTSCGRQPGTAAEGRLLEQVTLRGCDPISGAGSAETGIVVDASAAAAALGCVDAPEGVTPGPIEDLVVTNTTGGVIGSTVTIGCGQDPIHFESDVVPGETYTFRIEGKNTDGDVIAGATCSAVAREGLVVPASCQPLSDRAEIVIPVVELLEAADVVCGEGATDVRVALTAGPTTTSPEVLDCDRDVTIAGVTAGSYLASLEVLDAGEVVLAFSCTGSAPPGGEIALVCTAED